MSERVEAVYASHREPLAGPISSDHVANFSGATAAGRHRLTEAWAKSKALEGLFGVAISPAMLQAELDRMGRETLQPERLREIFGALDNDPEAAAEILARPLVADRLLRLTYASDKSLHETARSQASLALHQVSSGKDWPEGVGRLAKYVVGGQACRESTPDGPRWDQEGRRILSEEDWRERSSVWPKPGAPPRVEESTDVFTVTRVRKGADGLVEIEALTVPKKSFDEWWSDSRPTFLDKPIKARAAASYRMPTIAQAASCGTLGLLQGQPSPRRGASAVWTGTEMIFYGGETLYSDARGSGGRFDPATGAYRRLPTGPGNFFQAIDSVATWTGTQMVIFLPGYWGDHPLEGAAYDPASETWTSVSQGAGCPQDMRNLSVVWSGQEVLVWGCVYDTSAGISAVGARWNPLTNSWRSMSATGQPTPRTGFACVWASSEMIAFGGTALLGGDPSHLAGARYSPATDTWRPTSVQSGTPESYQGLTAVWTGTEMIVWGGSTGVYGYVNTGGRYNPTTDSWSPTSLTGAPAGRQGHTAVWTGKDMIVWGGVNRGPTGIGNEEALDAGGRYDPALDRWTPTPTDRFCPSGRKDHIALWTGTAMLVWTGDKMIVWGGQGEWYTYLNTGGLYDPVLDRWMATPTDGACPSPRGFTAAVWAGREMILWGGNIEDSRGQTVLLGSGARFSPSTRQWTAMPTTAGNPGARGVSASVWTGDSVIFWGGSEPSSPTLGTGSRFYPATGSWSPITTSGACPLARSSPTSIWTGTRMFIWGGGVWQASNGSGAFYDPDGDSWEEAPIPAERNWSNPMYIGGGRSPLLLFSGGERAGYTLSPCLSARALASPDPTAGTLTAKFQGFASGGQEPYAYDWDFGDGSAHGSGEVASHTYADAGAHSYVLTATDAAGASASQSKTVEIQPPPTITAVKALTSPFRLQVNGSGFQSGARVDINGTPAPTTQLTSSTQLQAGGGKTLKALLPKGTTVTVRVTNPDGLQATLSFAR